LAQEKVTCCVASVGQHGATRATQHLTTFSCAKMHVLDNVLCRDVTGQVKFGL